MSSVCYFVPRAELLPEFVAAGVVPTCLDHRRRSHGLRTLIRLVRLIRRQRIELIHTNLLLDSVYGRIAAALCSIPVVTTLHTARNPADFYRGRKHTIIYRAKDALGDLSARLLTSRFVAVSNAVSHTFTAHRRVPPGRAIVIHSGLPVDEFSGEAADPAELDRLRHEVGIADASPVLINVGRLHEQKGQQHLVPMMTHIVRRWPKAKLLIVGEGSERATLQQLILARGLSAHISLIGHRTDVQNLLAVSDLFVFPSIPGREGLPLAVLEAMAAGKPVVASRVEGVSEVVEDGGSGYLVEPGQPEALAEAVLRVLVSPERIRSMSARGQQIATERFDAVGAAGRLGGLYLSMLDEGRG